MMRTLLIAGFLAASPMLAWADAGGWGGPGGGRGNPHHSAPAPLLAAGLPGFAVLGGALGLRWKRRRDAAKNTAA